VLAHIGPHQQAPALLLPLHRLGQLPPRRVCSNRPIRADELDALVWAEVEQLLSDLH